MGIILTYYMGCTGMRVCFFALLFSFSFMLSAKNEGTQLRIQPVGKVSVQSSTKSKDTATGDVALKKESGHETYEHYCIVCHQEGLVGAPRFRHKQDWNSRLATRTLDDLVASSLKGLNAMPTKGSCIKCSVDDLKAAVLYMLPKS